jgi:hypothetical protein
VEKSPCSVLVATSHTAIKAVFSPVNRRATSQVSGNARSDSTNTTSRAP